RHRIAHRAAREELHSDPRHAQQREPDPQPAAQQHEEQDDEQRGDQGVHYSIALSSSLPVAISRCRISRTKSSSIATSRMTAPTAIAICGIQSGVASLPCETSLKARDCQERRTLYHASAEQKNVPAACDQISSGRRSFPKRSRIRFTRMCSP